MLNEISNCLDYYLGFFGGGSRGRMAPFSSFLVSVQFTMRSPGGAIPASIKDAPFVFGIQTFAGFI